MPVGARGLLIAMKTSCLFSFCLTAIGFLEPYRFVLFVVIYKFYDFDKYRCEKIHLIFYSCHSLWIEEGYKVKEQVKSG